MSRFPAINTALVPERAVLMGIESAHSAWPVESSLDELERLAQTDGAHVVGRLVQRLERPNPRTFIGSGKVEELVRLVHGLEADVVIFDDDLSPSQQTNLERAVGEPIKIIDRTALILDIFGQHARTHEGRLQVQLAQLQYLLPRLRGMWSHLAKEQTRGGIGSRFGQGESQLEVDRRMVRSRISALKRQLKELEKRRSVQSKERLESPAFRVALAGYTNAGKSSLLNALTASDVLAQDKLFATLDPTTRSLVLPGGRNITITDTVGFIQKLPTTLVESFKSSLAEVKSADLVLKVVDASDEGKFRQLASVNQVLDSIGAGERPALIVFNKVDLIDKDECAGLLAGNPGTVALSALTGQGIESLLQSIAHHAAAADQVVEAHLPYREGALLKLIHEQGQVEHEAYEAEFVHVIARVPPRLAARLKPFA